MAELLRARLILNPATGKELPPDPVRRAPERPTFSADGGRTWINDATNLPSPAPDPDRVNAREPIVAGRYAPGVNAMVRRWDQASGDPIPDAQGRPWPAGG